MNLKKILTLSAVSSAVLFGGAAYAGGPDVAVPAACPVCPPPFTPYLYIGASLGWAYSDWSSFIGNGLPKSADTNGFTYGGKIGYQFTDHFGVEGGGFGLPDSGQTINFGLGGVSGTVNSWIAYGAATLRAALPFNPYLHVIGKVGGVYRAVNHSGSLYNNVGDGDYGTVLFGGGLEYDLAANNLPLAVGIDYLYVPGSSDSFFNSSGPAFISQNAAPAAQIVVATLSVRLAV